MLPRASLSLCVMFIMAAELAEKQTQLFLA